MEWHAETNDDHKSVVSCFRLIDDSKPITISSIILYNRRLRYKRAWYTDEVGRALVKFYIRPLRANRESRAAIRTFIARNHEIQIYNEFIQYTNNKELREMHPNLLEIGWRAWAKRCGINATWKQKPPASDTLIPTQLHTNPSPASGKGALDFKQESGCRLKRQKIRRRRIRRGSINRRSTSRRSAPAYP